MVSIYHYKFIIIEADEWLIIIALIGLDPSGYRQAMRAQEEDDDDALLGGTDMSDEEKYKDCDRFKFKCPSSVCGREIIFDNVFSGAVSLFTTFIKH